MAHKITITHEDGEEQVRLTIEQDGELVESRIVKETRTVGEAVERSLYSIPQWLRDRPLDEAVDEA